ncbi:unnamed protein product [Cuscuta campestris]|uniref:Uncharacterized protein n=1 Tax=Cuscuta campestris TaxID=132261 RepID=A0A484N1E8_9ASTE|nr:unnamed protein product [Cuscuta campestris]
MEHPTAVRGSGGVLFEGLYRVVMRRTSCLCHRAGAFLGERAVGLRSSGRKTMLGNVTKIFQFWDRGQRNELRQSAHFKLLVY